MHLRVPSPLTTRNHGSSRRTARYIRTVAEVFSGININLALVEDGQAFA